MTGTSPPQRNAFLARLFGWTLETLDFFILVSAIKDVAKEFHFSKPQVALVLALTLACRPLMGLLFSGAAVRYDRLKLLTLKAISSLCFSLLCGVAPSLTALFIL